MQIESITTYIDSMYGEFLMLKIIDGAYSVQKSVHVKRPKLEDINCRYLRLIREAARDIAHEKHGADWRSHIKHQNFWVDPPDEEEAALIKQITEANDSLF